MSYAKAGPPFNFLGHLSESQAEVFEAWANTRASEFPAKQTYYQVAAVQLRKTAGLLEAIYQARSLTPTFEKPEWRPVEGGHIVPAARDDRHPSDAMSEVKGRLLDPLALDDEAVFRMNLLRVRVEAMEDKAQEMLEAPELVKARLAELKGYFADPHYQTGALVRDKSDLYEGEPKFRVHPLDPPTKWERLNAGAAPTTL